MSAVFDLLRRVAEAFVATVGGDCEAVVHDLRHPEHSVVAISGQLTGRRVGAPVPDPELLPGVVDSFIGDDLQRHTVTPNGRELVSSTVWVRDPEGHIVGALCVNLDLADLRRARDIIDRRLIGQNGADAASLTTFATNVAELTRLALKTVARDASSPLRRLSRRERVEIVRSLDRAGVFTLRGAALSVGQELGVSRASVYADLGEARQQNADARAGGGARSFGAEGEQPGRAGKATPLNPGAMDLIAGRQRVRSEGGIG